MLKVFEVNEAYAAAKTRYTRTYLTHCTNQMVLENQLPHKIIDSLFEVDSEQ